MILRHIYWFAYFNLDEPSVRYRAKYPLEQLQIKHNIKFSIVYPGYDFQNLSNFILTYFSALLFRKRNSVIVFQKINTKGIYSTALKILLFFRSKYTLYDIDDAEYIRRPPQTIHYFMKNCSACSAGSKSLVDYIKRINQNVFLLTSPVTDHGLTKTETEKTFTVGWIGYYGAHRQNLTKLFFPALLDIDFPVKLKLLGVKNEAEEKEIKTYFKHKSNILVDTPVNLDWLNERSIYENVMTFDIGVAPLLDNEFNCGKSAFKLKQCLSCGVPVLGSRVGENLRFLQHGVNGYFCDKPNDYFEKLVLIKNSKNGLFNKLCTNAKSTYPSFSIDHYCSTFLNYFNHEKT